MRMWAQRSQQRGDDLEAFGRYNDKMFTGFLAVILTGLIFAASAASASSDTASAVAEIEALEKRLQDLEAAMKKNAAPRPAASAVKQKEVMSGWSYTPGEGVTYDTGRYYLNLTADLIGSVMYMDDGSHMPSFAGKDAWFVGADSAKRSQIGLEGAAAAGRATIRANVDLGLPVIHPVEQAGFHGWRSYNNENYENRPGYSKNRELLENRNDQDRTADFELLRGEIDIDHPDWGGLAFGYGPVATDGVITGTFSNVEHMTLEAMDVGRYSSMFTRGGPCGTIGCYIPTVLISGSSYDGPSDARVLLRTPRLWGVGLTGSVTDGSVDLAADWLGNFYGVDARVAAGYRHLKFRRNTLSRITGWPEIDLAGNLQYARWHYLDVGRVVGGSIAFKYKSGANMAAGVSITRRNSYSSKHTENAHLLPDEHGLTDSRHWHVAAGWDRDWFDMGETRLLGVYGVNKNNISDADETRYWKIGVEQEIERIDNLQVPIGLDLFANYGVYDFVFEDSGAYNKDMPMPDGAFDRKIKLGLAGLRIRL